jgi:hypothetical protein
MRKNSYELPAIIAKLSSLSQSWHEMAELVAGWSVAGGLQ